MAQSLEAKIVVLGAQGVGKTSLLYRYIKNQFTPASTTSTVGASFMTKRVVDDESDTVVRLQIWDTAGQERFRSISRLYYRGANACILCYSITDLASFEEMGVWLTELRRNLPPDIILHVVGTKADLVARDPTKREVPFERCIAYVAENLAPGMSSTPPATATPGGIEGGGFRPFFAPRQEVDGARSPSSKRSSGFWGQEVGWDCCHEVSAESGEGVEEVFRVITRKLVEQDRVLSQQLLSAAQTPGVTPGLDGPGEGGGGYFEGMRPGGSFRVGRDRRSWFGVPVENYIDAGPQNGPPEVKQRRKCC
ncbi:P-loop containing nucleoside triphosphate hydrolase [Glarea lozoyensis ATCC 20868]|uniref:p-loop containing nucleoside triphosphate hydrolase n=1 Tax=Glarea lozoyensis (strain ATCC 20868 / MF5171) TaxID=1116229 RepID=S3CH51_GLAL2|nr:P-loop containing nucleoside triphosphate hydrolase [Glarea lozoyensis ATCC 20868]EPE24624.1 P-loop containing nucleoside triphosphate hydrolase [Glarea lozoyensis ATCC 20868]